MHQNTRGWWEIFQVTSPVETWLVSGEGLNSITWQIIWFQEVLAASVQLSWSLGVMNESGFAVDLLRIYHRPKTRWSVKQQEGVCSSEMRQFVQMFPHERGRLTSRQNFVHPSLENVNHHKDGFQSWKVDSHSIHVTKVTSDECWSCSRCFLLWCTWHKSLTSIFCPVCTEITSHPCFSSLAWCKLQQRAPVDQPRSLTVVMTIDFVWDSYIKHFLLSCFFISDVFVDGAGWYLKDHSMGSARKRVENIRMQPPTYSLPVC